MVTKRPGKRKWYLPAWTGPGSPQTPVPIEDDSERCADDAWWEADERQYCVSCGAEVDHYLGCPDDPNPDYEAEEPPQ